MNRLQYETSPYLLQHAHNPVDWYAWKPEAFERARREDKPILVSIGYSTCHWCHVMERESFEDPQIAGFMNDHFINIKVDREERPDVDQIYMDACQAFSGQGGWPLNCFLTPDRRPFFAGTYYPPRPAHNRLSWRQLLENVLAAFRDKRELVERQADRLTEIVGRSDTIFIKEAVVPPGGGPPSFPEEEQRRLCAQLREQFDRTHGGFGGAPKFPGSMTLEYLLRYAYFFHEEEARQHVELSLERMIHGGIYDQLGGGFARYATDRAWLVPHFEKMLYDNALLVHLLAGAYQWTGRDLYRETIEETLAFIAREMTSPEGGFYSALDADSEGEEGKFYVWDQEEIEAVAGADAPLFCDFYGVQPEGNWEGRNILWRRRSFADYARARGMEEGPLRRRLADLRRRLLDRREERVRPGLDDKIILGWNALQVSAYARAYQALGVDAYREAALRNLRFLESRLQAPEGGGYFHTYKEGTAHIDAFLDDYALLIAAFLDGYRLAFDQRLLDEALRLTEWVRQYFFDPGSGLFFFTASPQQDLPLRKKELFDSATPSGNSTMVGNLLQLALLFDRRDYQELAVGMLNSLREAIGKYPSTFARWAAATLELARPGSEIAVVGAGAEEIARRLSAHFLPHSVLMAAREGDERFPLLAGKPGGDPARIYVCRRYACSAPVTEPEEALKMVSP